MRTSVLLFVAIIIACQLPAVASRTCQVEPPADGAYATDLLQQAVHECQHGTVTLSPGTYLTAAVLISGTLSLHLPQGAIITAGTQRGNYPGGWPDWYLLNFHKCRGCRLYGGGTIDGQGRVWVDGYVPGDRKLVRNFEDPSCPKPEECRPRLVGVTDSEDVVIAGVSLVDPIYWSLHIMRSRKATVRDVNITSDWDIANTDGIDIDGSADVEVSSCHIHTADDAICLKTSSPGYPTERVSVHNCTLQSRSSAVKLGSESRAPFRHVDFRNLKILDSHRGLAIQLRDEGSVEHICFADITLSTRYYNQTWWGAAEPIYVTASPRTSSAQVGRASRIFFSNIRATAENGIFIAGAAGQRILDLSFSDVQLDLMARSSWPGGNLDYRPGVRGLVHTGGTYPLWMEFVAGASFNRVKVVYHAPFRRDWELSPRLDQGTVRNTSFRHFSIKLAPGTTFASTA